MFHIGGLSDFFGLFSKMALRTLLIFCMSVEDNRAHCLSQMVFLKRNLNPGLYMGLSDQGGVFSFTFLSFSQLL